ncbi:phosphatidylglycerol lysyltransferase domain-containing protein [Phycicoccus sp. 3266]|uniref:phosphatidylglycerol lysyltransferase domain-containing protein n=1 Tax=Phycicoccus sp. 3266 TaxID=2817751 RepID=UPI00286208E3|nr:phosphatidylglycerol lysyltransferase domain-containing protein [Phycicoccus sp. 3266]MDR6863682.1 lysyl-tRNA synthetase class 2 [Phycicoccus sp. 3266]
MSGRESTHTTTTRLPGILTPSKAPALLGNLTYLIGLLDLLTGLLHSWRHRLLELTEVLPGALSDAAAAATVVSGVLLFVLGHSLKRRKRRAWRAAVALLGISVVLHAAKVEPVSTLVSLSALALLVRNRREFFALGDPSTRWRAVRAFLVLGTVSFLAGTAAIWMNRRHIVGGFPSFPDLVRELLYGAVGVSGPLQFTHHREDDILGSLLLGLGLMTAFTTIYLALRPAEPRPELTDDDDERLRMLMQRHADSLAYFNTRRDKSVVWSPTGKAAVAYRVVSGVMLASGDPLGDPEAWPGAIEAFLEEARNHAWTPAVLGCSEQAGTVWVRETGFTALELGDEAVVDTTTFTLQGRPMRNVRQMVGRIERAGYAVDVTRVRDVDPVVRDEAMKDASAWRSSDTERGFSMALGRLVDPVADPDCVFVTARHEGVVRAFLQFVPWGDDGMSLDVMRRDSTAEAGVNELMIATALQRAPELGVRRVSLNFAAFRSALERGERLGAGPVLRLWRRVLLFASRWLQIESLYRFNAKFQPQWQPRFLVYPAAGDLPRVALASLEAEAFLVWPKLGRLNGAREAVGAR